jgi:hypothetical protein
MATTQNPRTLTIERRYRRSEWGAVFLRPKLLLSSQLLAAAGFTAGDEIHVQVAEGQLTLSTSAIR